MGEPLRPNAAVANRYQADIDRLINQMIAEYERRIKALYKREGGVTFDASLASQLRILLSELGSKWTNNFNNLSNKSIKRLIEQADRSAGANLSESLKKLAGGITIKTPKRTAEMTEKLKAAIAENVSLITSIPEQYHFKIEGVVMRSIQQGGEGAHDIYNHAMREITTQGINVHKRARLIAQLETAKISATIQTERMKSAGVSKFRWRHSGGGAEPRELHLEYDGQVFEVDNPPIIDERTGQRGMPGTIWNCKCYAEPVIELG